MDAEEFLKKVAPLGSRSRMAPYWGDIVKLREHGCTLDQVCAFLAANQVKVTKAGLSQYIRRREAKGGLERRSEVTPQTAQKSTPPEDTKKITNPAGLRERRKREINLDDYLNVEGE